MPPKTDNGTAYITYVSGIDARGVQALMRCITGLPKSVHTLHILLATGGGSVTYGCALYHWLRALPHKLIMHNIDSVDSIGLIVFLAADTRYAAKHATFLSHRVSSKENIRKTEASMLREKLNAVETEERKIRAIYAERCAMPEADLDRLFESGELKAVDYALEYGIIHAQRDPAFPAGAPVHVVETGEQNPT